MRFSTAFLLAAGVSLCAALPTELKDFLLVTTSQAVASDNTAELKAVSATSLFVHPPSSRVLKSTLTYILQDPFNQPALVLRLTGPGYMSLPTFTLTDGTLSSIATAPFNGGKKRYNSTIVAEGKELQFLASVQPKGNMALNDGYLLTVDGEQEGWAICDGALGSQVLNWKNDAEGCEKTYVHAVTKAPY
jgi:hypothetical protein